jgi:anti-sigma regulatory factor (Ser/Thr protein kinase)
MKKIDIKAFIRTSKKREKRRLKRLNKKRRLKKRQVQHKAKKKRINILIPESIDLNENREKFISLLEDIQDVLLNGKNFLIDHRNMKKITKEALLLLTSEIERCTTIMRIKLKAKSKFAPKNGYIRTLLKKIGYWEYFKLNLGKSGFNGENDSELYMKIVGDTTVSGEKIGNLIQFFEELICFDNSTKDKFSDAMMEAAANTVEHAYSKEQKIQNIKKWWLTASINKFTNEISFIFYDQGLGILKTLEATQKYVMLKRLVAGWIAEGVSQGGILRKLITTNLSSYKNERRGNGLISFKTFIDQVRGGELTIYTDNVSYSAISDKIVDYKSSIQGTLIVWKIEANLNDKCIYIKGVNDND